ncbi:hypothetical protein KO527_10765 [Pseudoalteromonas sp. C2R02]|uniref:ABC-three component system protein n=1 Tax=Pseudoalteromonas sp. C2R02 TaxID=2841565 RepID=UPI001C09DD8C|nr:ABC-three component system protein [Pseudoalteromonas sp. C2R02]MBU2969828.1 hypothetical protein [Pseudoalteromonas sp. C2R02]
MSLFSMFRSSRNSKHVELRDVKAGNDVIVGDKLTILPAPSQMDMLSKKFTEEKNKNITTTKIINELNHYCTDKSEARELSNILSEAGFDYLIKNAEELKELISMLIIEYQHYKSAQKMITFLLAEVESIFNCKIKSQLRSVEEENQIKVIFRNYLEGEIQAHLGENVLEIFNRQIHGMVFFLTGNSHLEWR